MKQCSHLSIYRCLLAFCRLFEGRDGCWLCCGFGIGLLRLTIDWCDGGRVVGNRRVLVECKGT